MAVVQKPDYNKKRKRDEYESVRGEWEARKSAQAADVEGEPLTSPGCKRIDKKHSSLCSWCYQHNHGPPFQPRTLHMLGKVPHSPLNQPLPHLDESSVQTRVAPMQPEVENGQFWGTYTCIRPSCSALTLQPWGCRPKTFFKLNFQRLGAV